jgi:hypothetical protein
MENVKSFLTRIRQPDKSTPRHIQILVSIGIAMAGFALGVLQKWLDSGAVNELPIILQRIDIGNYFGRLFYTLSFIIIAKTIIVEALRITAYIAIL